MENVIDNIEKTDLDYSLVDTRAYVSVPHGTYFDKSESLNLAEPD